jgi:hypothetical protein
MPNITPPITSQIMATVKSLEYTPSLAYMLLNKRIPMCSSLTGAVLKIRLLRKPCQSSFLKCSRATLRTTLSSKIALVILSFSESADERISGNIKRRIIPIKKADNSIAETATQHST